MRQLELLIGLLVVVALCGCGDERSHQAGPRAGRTLASATGSALAAAPGGLVLPPKRPVVTNPLGLPAVRVTVTKGMRVFAVPRRMLEQAKLGSALQLRAAFVEGQEGDDLLVRIGHGVPFLTHPGYVVVPRMARFRRGGQVIASYRGRLRHAVVKSLRHDAVMVRFTDLGTKSGEQKLDPRRVGVLAAGLAPGAYAVRRAEHEYRHVLLVSRGVYRDGAKRWLVLGRAGEAQLIDEGELRALPVPRFKPKVGSPVLAAWRGSMVRAQLKAVDRPALYQVARPRAGGKLWVGPGMIMPPE